MENKDRTTPLKEMFNLSTAEVHRSFPEQLKFLLVVSTEQTLFISPEIAEHLSANTEKVKKLIKWQKKYLSDNHAAGLASKSFPFDSELDVKIIALNLNHNFRQHYSNCDRNMMVIATADHELGHLVVKNATAASLFTSPHEAETCADAFAAIRHIQRFGSKTDWFKAYNRSNLIVFDISPDHYTSSVLQKIESLSKEQDLSKLSLIETAKLAKNISNDYSLNKNTLKRMSTVFKNIGNKYKNKIDFNNPESGKRWEDLKKQEQIELLEDLTKIMFDNKDDPDIYRAGNLFISRKDVQELVKDINPSSTLSSNIKEMKAFEKTSGITLNLAEAIDNYNKSGWTNKLKMAFK